METKSNYRRVNLRTQSMALNDLPPLNHPSPLPLASQSDKHHKELMFLHVRIVLHFIYTSLFNIHSYYFVLKIYNLLYACAIWLII